MQQSHTQQPKGLRTYQYLVKVVFAGDFGVGKTQFIFSWTDEQVKFSEDHDQTIGVEFSAHFLAIGQEMVKVQICDTAGDPEFLGITKSYYHGAHVFCLAWNSEQLKKEGASDQIATIFDELVGKTATGQSLPKLILVRTKSDRSKPEEAKQIVTDESTLMRMAEKKGFIDISTVVTSAKDRKGFGELDACVRKFVEKNKDTLRVKGRQSQFGLSAPRVAVVVPKMRTDPFVECLKGKEMFLFEPKALKGLFQVSGDSSANNKKEMELSTRIEKVQACKKIQYEKGDRGYRYYRLGDTIMSLTDKSLKKEMIWLLLNLLSIGQRALGKISYSLVSGYLENCLDAFFQYPIVFVGQPQKAFEYYVLHNINQVNFCDSVFPALRVRDVFPDILISPICAVLHLLMLLNSEEKERRALNRHLKEPTKQALYEVARNIFDNPTMTKESIPRLLADKTFFPETKTAVEEILNQYLADAPIAEPVRRSSFGSN